jgi:glycosyltransferase involved in cell wall biosynthesis
MARVSVLLPSYNHEAFIGEAVTSVLGQTLSDLELVIVDDGSTDGSWKRIEAFDDRRIVRHRQENRGAHAALNKAGELASPKSEFVAILNSDDVWSPRWLEAALGALEARPRAGFCCARLRLTGSEQDPKMAGRRAWYQDGLRRYRESGDLEASLLHANFIVTTSNVVVRHDLFRAAGGFRPLRYVHDLDFFLRLASESELAFVDEELVTYRCHPGNTIRETERDERSIVFEFGWILADVLERLVARTPDPEALEARVLALIAARPKPAIAAVALAILLPRCAAAASRGARTPPAPIEEILGDDHPVRAAMTAAEVDPREVQIAGLESTIAKQLTALATLEHAYRDLERTRERELVDLQKANDDRREMDRSLRAQNAEIERLKRTRSYLMADAIGRTRGLGDALRLPGRLARIALEKRASGEPRGT